jgi:hypothetical protein
MLETSSPAATTASFSAAAAVLSSLPNSVKFSGLTGRRRAPLRARGGRLRTYPFETRRSDGQQRGVPSPDGGAGLPALAWQQLALA